MLRQIVTTSLITKRTFRNFGHKREPIPLVTTIWHGFLTFTFIGLGLNWEKISTFMFGDKDYDAEMKDGYIKRKEEI